ncbi:MAG: lytic transglycosylase domain-containing protein [Paracoccaceae bacterium]
MRLMAGILAAACACASVGHAEEAADPYDFTFKRIKVSATPGKRITVQIDPVEQARLLARRPSTAEHPEVQPAPGPIEPGEKVDSTYAWFWDSVPTARDAKDGRFPRALAALSQGPGGAAVNAPRMQYMQQIAQAYGTEILQATIGTQVSPALVLAVIGIESAGNPEAISSAGAQGLMQLIPATAERFGVKDSKDPAQNIKGGVAYLDWLMTQFDRDPLMVLAAYNAGEGAVRANNGVPPYAETRDYVPKVLAAWQVAQGLCATPPELVTDPCVFRIIAAGG